MDSKTIHNFVARGEVFRNNLSGPVTISGSYPIYAPDPVRCKVIPDMQNWPVGLAMNDHNLAQMRGKTENDKDIWIPNFRIDSSTNSHGQVYWQGIAEFFVEGDLNEFDASDGEIIYTLSTSPTPIALSGVRYNLKDDGTVTIWNNAERKGIRWQTTLGEVEFIDNYIYFTGEKIGLDQTKVQIQRCQIIAKKRITGIVSLKLLLNDLREMFNEALWLLSFLSRMRVVWYEAEVLFCPDDSNPIKRFHRAVARRSQWLGYPRNEILTPHPSFDVLVEHQALKDGVFQQMLTNYGNSSHQDTIYQAILHLMASYERAYLESQYASAYTALECLVYGLDKDGSISILLKPNSYKRLSKELRSVIRNQIKAKDIAKGVFDKLPELKRRSFLDQLFRLIEIHEVDIAKLWPPDSDIMSELKELRNRRNEYFHQGKTASSDSLVFDLNRLQNLVELWILKLLGCPDTVINPLAIGHLTPN